MNNLVRTLLLLSDDSSEVRESAREAFRECWGSWRDEWILCFSDEDPAVRAGALYSLSEVECTDEDLLQALLDLTRDREAVLRGMACLELERFKDSAERILPVAFTLTDDPDPYPRRSAIQLIEALSHDSTCLRKIATLLHDVNAYVRHDAVIAISKAGYSVPLVQDRIVSLLQDPDCVVREAAAKSLGRLLFSKERASRELVQLLDDPVTDVKIATCDAIAKGGFADKPVVYRLINLLLDTDTKVRRAARECLASAGAIAIPPLIELLRTADSQLRAEACMSLGKMGPIFNGPKAEASQRINALKNCQWDGAVNVRVQSSLAIWRITGRTDLDVLEDALRSCDPEVALAVCEAACLMGPAAHPLQNAIAPWCLCEDFWASFVAATALGRVRANSWISIESVQEMLGLDCCERVARAARVLGILGPAEGSIPRLIAAANRQWNHDYGTYEVQVTSLKSLGRIATTDNISIEELRESIQAKAYCDEYYQEGIEIALNWAIKRIARRSLQDDI